MVKLVAARIQNFRSIDDTGVFKIADTTCLVGKNEAGKTAILQALEVVNSYSGNNEYNRLREYPRRFYKEYAARHDGEEATVATTDWELDDADKKAIEDELGAGCLPKPTITISKSYGSAGTDWETHFDEAVAIKFMVDQANLDAAEQSVVESCSTAIELVTKLDGRSGNTTKHIELLSQLQGYPDADPESRAIEILGDRLPLFLYFSHYNRMSGKISVARLKKDIENETVSEGDSVFLDFLEFAETNVEQLESIQNSEDLIANVEAASNIITDRIFEFWSQNNSLSVEFKPYEGRLQDDPPFNSGTVMEARVENALHRVSVPFSERSAGFIWFFSFLVRFAKVSKEHDNIIILLDEPGLTLHAKAQADLLRFFDEKLKPHHQVIYTTHSPFMVPTDDIMSVRTVEDVIVPVGDDSSSTGPNKFKSIGTKVGDDVLSTDKDTIFPLQGALGYEITQSLFVGKHTLLVEGPSDVLYLQAASAALKAANRIGLDSQWTICPTGGIDKVSAFISLFGGNKLDIAVLTDYATGQKRKVERLRESELLKEGRVYTIADFCEKEEGDIEDMFSPSLFASIVSAAYGLPDEHLLTAETLEDADNATIRQVAKAEAYFRLLPDEIENFDHFAPSSWLIQHPEVLSSSDSEVLETLARFEALFETFNPLLEQVSD